MDGFRHLGAAQQAKCLTLSLYDEVMVNILANICLSACPADMKQP